VEFQVNGTLIQQYYICKREVWLSSHQIIGDQDNENLQIGRIIGEYSYDGAKKEVDLGNAKLDLIRSENGYLVVGEIKKSSRFIYSSSKQLLFYLMQIKQMGITARGELLIPEERKKIEVILNDINENEIRATIKDIEKIVSQDKPPEALKTKYCGKCAYAEFCWA
jgi:CRISPR-associated exonuclease Cas4